MKWPLLQPDVYPYWPSNSMLHLKPFSSFFKTVKTKQNNKFKFGNKEKAPEFYIQSSA